MMTARRNSISKDISWILVLAKKLTPILAFGVLWTLIILTFFDWRYFSLEVAVFLLVPVLAILALLSLAEILKHYQRMSQIGTEGQKSQSGHASFQMRLGNLEVKLDDNEMIALRHLGNLQRLGIPRPSGTQDLKKTGLTEKEIKAAVKKLHGKGLIELPSSQGIWLTDLGEKVSERLT